MLVTSILLLLPTLLIFYMIRSVQLQTLYVGDIEASVVIMNFIIFNCLCIYHFVLKKVYNDICKDTGTDVGTVAKRIIYLLSMMSMVTIGFGVIGCVIVFLGLFVKYLKDVKHKR